MRYWLGRLTTMFQAEPAGKDPAAEVPVRLALAAAALGMILGTAGTPDVPAGTIRIETSAVAGDPVAVAADAPAPVARRAVATELRPS